MRLHLFDSLLSTSTNLKTNSRNRWIIWLSLGLAALFLYLALRNLDWASFFVTLAHAQYGFLPLVLAWSSLSYFVRALRWRVLLLAEKPISRGNAFYANMSGYLGNNILPARAGELIRAAYVDRALGLSLSFALASGLSERLMDVFALIFIGAVSLSLTGINSGVFQRAIQVMAVVAGVGAIIFLFLPNLGTWFRKTLERTTLLNQSIHQKLLTFLDKFFLGLRALLHPQRAAAFGLYTIIVWLMDGLGVVLMGYLLRVPVNLTQALVLLAGLGLSSAIPSAPGYVGVYQFVAVAVLEPFGIESAAALALILFLQISGWLVIGGWGLVAIVQISRAQKVID